jgi:penicillin-binding protein 1A
MPPRHKKSISEKTGKKPVRIFSFLLILIVIVVLVTACGSVVYYMLTADLPGILTLKDYRPSIASRVYDDNNELIDEFFLEDRKIVKINEVPQIVPHAFVAAEDSRFYQHQGFDMQSISRAFFKNFEAGRIVQGASTITQQVAKMMYLSPEKKYIRKIKEAILAYKIDKYLTKEEILNLYLNQIYLGHGTYGIESASLGYFGKSAKELTLPEAALLAGLPKAPSAYSPFLHYEKAKQRQTYVLTRMMEDGYITAAEMQRAAAAPVKLRPVKPKDRVAAYFVEHVRRYVQEKYEHGLVQGALYCMEVRTGAIRAMIGGRDFTKSEFNRATQSRRQPGSAFKPLIYTAAFDKGLNPSTRFVDSPIVFEDPSQ